MNQLSEKTLIPLGLVMSFIGGVIYVTVAFYKSEAQGSNILKIEHRLETLEEKRDQQIQEILKRIDEVNNRVIRIETKIEKSQ